jgi:hypothetical protein
MDTDGHRFYKARRLISSLGRWKFRRRQRVFSGGFEVVETLGGVFGGQALGAFQFDDDGVLDEDVGFVDTDWLSLVGDRDGGLGDGFQALERKFYAEGAFVDFF